MYILHYCGYSVFFLFIILKKYLSLYFSLFSNFLFLISFFSFIIGYKSLLPGTQYFFLKTNAVVTEIPFDGNTISYLLPAPEWSLPSNLPV